MPKRKHISQLQYGKVIHEIVAASPNGVAILDEEGIIYEWNYEFERILEIPAKDAVNKVIWELPFRFAPDMERSPDKETLLRSYLQEMIKEDTPAAPVIHVIYNARDEKRILRFRNIPVDSEGQRFIGIMCTDISNEEGARTIIEGQEKLLKENRAFLQGIIQTLPLPLFIRNPEGVFLDCNDAFLKYFGLQWEQVIGNTAVHIFPDEKQSIQQIENKLLRADKNYQGEFSFQKDGKTYYSVVSLNNIYDKNHNHYGVIGIVLDVTELKETQRDLKEEHNKLQSINDNFPDGALFRFVFNTETNAIFLEYLSATWPSLMNVSIEDSFKDYSNALAMVHPDDLPSLVDKVIECGTEIKKISAEIRIFRNKEKNEIRWLEVSSHPRKEEGEILFDGFIQDITERKRIEQDLIAERNRLKAIGDNFPNEALLRLETDLEADRMQFTYLSKTWSRITGLNMEKSLKDISYVFDAVHPEDLPMLMKEIRKSITSQKSLNTEIRFTYKQKKYRWVQVSSFPHLENGKVVSDGFILDISERKRVEEELEKYRMNLEALVKVRTEQLEIINQDLNTANEELTSINEELFRNNELLEEEIANRKQLMQMLEESEKMRRSFIEQSLEGIILSNEEGIIVEWNRKQEELTRIPREEAIGRHEWDLLFRLEPPGNRTPEVYEALRQQRLNFIAKGAQQNYFHEEKTLYMDDGSKKHIEMAVFPVILSDKYFWGIVTNDITEEKRISAELGRYQDHLEQMVEQKTRELTESQERLISLSNNLPGGVIFQCVVHSITQQVKYTFVSDTLVDIMGIGADDLLNDSNIFFDMVHPDDWELFSRFSADTMNFKDVEFRIILRSGEIKWIHTRAIFRAFDSENSIFEGFMLDITNRKTTELELEQSRKRQTLLINILRALHSAEDMDKAIDYTLAQIGTHMDVSRVYIFEKTGNGQFIRNIYEWCNTGISSEKDNLQKIPVEDAKIWFDKFDTGEFVSVSDIRILPPEIIEHLEPQGIKSILVLPLTIKGDHFGFIGFDECKIYRTWKNTDIRHLISLSQIISTTIRRNWAEKSILQSRQTLRTVMDNIDANIYVFDFETTEILFANKRLKELIGDFDIEGKAYTMLPATKVPPLSYTLNSELKDEHKIPGRVIRRELIDPITTKWFDTTDAAIKWIDGRMVHMKYSTDITKRKKAEEALRQSEEMYRQLIVASPDAIVVCDPQGKALFISPKTREMFDIDEDIPIENISLEKYVHPQNSQLMHNVFRKVARENLVSFQEFLLVCEDGTEFFGEISMASVRDDNDDLSSVIMVIRDITDRKNNEAELIRAKEKAEESDMLKSSFLANMSHEIRTPINGIIGFLNFLSDDNLPAERRHKYIKIINNSSIQLAKLIDDIIDIAKIEARQMDIRPVPFRLNEFMKELHMFFETYLHSKQKDKVALILDDNLFLEDSLIYADPLRLRQILSNLISNAAKFTDKGFISFGYRKSQANMLEFTVEDTGIGMEKDQLDIIFERFRQAKPSNNRHYGGTGLGLTISRSLVQMMGGDISVCSVPHQGSTFTFTISYIPVAKEDEPLFEIKEEKSGLNLQKTVLLVIEPEIMKYKYYEGLLSQTGISLLLVQDMEQWPDVVRKDIKIDMVLANVKFFTSARENIRRIQSLRKNISWILVNPRENAVTNKLIRFPSSNFVLTEPVHFKELYAAIKIFNQEMKLSYISL